MTKEYVERRDGNYYVSGTRVSLDSLIHAFHRGESPETIRQNFELLLLEEVYGAIAYYLANQTEWMRTSSAKRRNGPKGNAHPSRFPRVYGRGSRVCGTRYGQLHLTSHQVKVRFLAGASGVDQYIGGNE